MPKVHITTSVHTQVWQAPRPVLGLNHTELYGILIERCEEVRATSQLSLLGPVVMVEKVPSAATPAGVKLYTKSGDW